MSNNNLETLKDSSPNPIESGFTLIEAVIAIFVLTIGLVGTAAAITYALQFGAISQNVTKAKLLVVASFEEIESLRNSRRLDFKQIANAGSVNNTDSSITFNGFSNGLKPISFDPGPDAVFGTDDDLSISPGPDGVFGTADDVTDQSRIRGNYTREITISNISPTIKKVEVKVRYPGSGATLGEITGVCYLNDEARLTR